MISFIVTLLIMMVVAIRAQFKIYSLKAEIEDLCRTLGVSWPFWSEMEFFALYAFLPKTVISRLSGSEAIEQKVSDLINVRKGWLKFGLVLSGIWISMNVIEILITAALE